MGGRASGEILRHSVLDRFASGVAAGGDARIGVRELVAAVRRDLEWLLNTRCSVPYDLEDLPETRESLLNYGLPDFSQYSSSSPADCQRISEAIVRTLRRFEPRLAPQSIRVESLASTERVTPTASFRIHAVLHVDPVKEPVVFDAEVRMDTGVVEVKSDQ